MTPADVGGLVEKVLFEELAVAEKSAQYDEHAKGILSNRYVLARILHDTVEEFYGIPIEEIAKECIGDEPTISNVAVLPGQTDVSELPEKILGDSNESTIPNEGRVTFDVCFHAYTPKSRDRQKLLFDMEAQKKFSPGYEINTRGIFYGSRMISSQVNTEFNLNNYDDIKKVYSIWICMNAPNYIGNAVSKYKMIKEDMWEGIPDKPYSYDKITVIQICLNRKMPDKEKSVTRLLNILFSEKLSAKEKDKVLSEEFEIEHKNIKREELNSMCNLGEGIYENGIEEGISIGRTEGISIGISQGISQGISMAKADSVENVMNNLQVTLEKACDIIGITVANYYAAKSLE